MIVIADKLEVDCELTRAPLSINAPFYGYLKLVKATQKGKKLKQGCDVTGDRTRDPAHQRPRTNAPINVNPVGGGGGVRAMGGDLTNFKIVRSNSPGWETKGQSKVSKKAPTPGEKI